MAGSRPLVWSDGAAAIAVGAFVRGLRTGDCPESVAAAREDSAIVASDSAPTDCGAGERVNPDAAETSVRGSAETASLGHCLCRYWSRLLAAHTDETASDHCYWKNCRSLPSCVSSHVSNAFHPGHPVHQQPGEGEAGAGLKPTPPGAKLPSASTALAGLALLAKRNVETFPCDC